MQLLVTNDDGVEAPGLSLLAQCAAQFGQTVIVAPASAMSAVSHTITLHKPLRIFKHKDDVYSVSGTPVDSVYLAVNYIMQEPPALVLSGINDGWNLGENILYSGTVAAAREAALQGIPAIAFSTSRISTVSRETVTKVITSIIAATIKNCLPPDTFLNVNIPRHEENIQGIRIAPMGYKKVERTVHTGTDPRGREYIWIDGQGVPSTATPGRDEDLTRQGYIVITPLGLDQTMHSDYSWLQSWEIQAGEENHRVG